MALRAPTSQVKIYKADLCTDSDCFEMYPTPSSTKQKISFVRYYVDIRSLYAINFQQDLYYGSPALYDECEFLQDKILLDYSVDQCSDDLSVLYFTHRNALTVDEVITENSPITYAFYIVFSLLAVLFI